MSRLLYLEDNIHNITYIHLSSPGVGRTSPVL